MATTRDGSERVTVRLDAATIGAAREAAESEKISLSKFIRDAVLYQALRVKLRGASKKKRSKR